ncbi:MAG: RecX family transcriptional regulator [Lutibacter sp.]|uniref:regulatory protein RecX n=1 Tax=Lutibacter sp. TaxID=1925666 RepID=UPI001831030B|nr:regulatory protein RecX [Lutibacter sp.]MBT8316736.1 RecX family transcriptional regulator [Lutibacter sp.]NNJ57596.1 RecX family transcriptional regulator [Lutibacter sp.]
MKNKKSYTVDEARKVLEHFCAYQERCHKEVEQKLYDLKMIPEAKEQIILHLLQHNFLNEERFSKAFVRGKFTIKKWGRIKIVNELKFRNISSYNIKTALKEINEDDYLNVLLQLAEKKLTLIKETNSFKKKNKLSTYLVSKGFETNLVYTVSNSLL